MSTEASLKLTVAVVTDVGKSRERNEDSNYLGERVFAVADGLGGHSAGEVASSIAVGSIAQLDHDGTTPHSAFALVDAVERANREVFERAQHDPDLRGMATTITAVSIGGTTAHLAHVGDSRCYLLRDGAISQVTQDHTLVARMVAEGKLTQRQAETHPQRSVVTRALGAGPEVEVDTLELELLGGDRLLLCSDGLTETLTDEEIREFAVKRAPLEDICRALVDEANARGGPDNITILLVAVEGPRHRPEPAQTTTSEPAGSPPRAARRRRIPVRALVWTGILVVVIVAGIVGVRTWIDRSWYVGIDGNAVAIYRGLPTDTLGKSLHHVEERTTIPVSQVAPYYRPRLDDGIRVNSLADARKLVQSIPTMAPATPTPKPSPSRSP